MTDIKTIKTALEDKLRALNERAQEIDNDLSEAPDADWSENAVESENDEVLERVGDMALNEIQQIKNALLKIEAGTYGTCDRCEGNIGAKRLEALPYATKCIKCA